MFTVANKNWFNGLVAASVVTLISVYPDLRAALEQTPFVQQNPWVIPVLTFLVGLFTKFYKTEETADSELD